MKQVLVVNGPNLNLLGTRDPAVYGATDLAQLDEMCVGWGEDLGFSVECLQSNHEGDLIDMIHGADVDGIVLNPGAYTHYAYALHDAIDAVRPPVVEVHISNIYEREPWRRVSVVAPACVHSIFGRGVDGYRWALRHLANRLALASERIVYGPDSSQFGDLRLPTGSGPHPAVLLIHGGFWRRCWALDTTESIAVDLAKRGIATFNLEYRRIGNGGGPEATTADVRAGLASLRAHPLIDTGRIAVAGHSAGGQLAMLSADDVAVSISLGGVLDLAAAVSDSIGDGAAVEFLGDEPPDKWSPLSRLPIGSKLIVAHGDDDTSVPVAYAHRFASAAGAAGDRVELGVTPDGDHMGFLDPGNPMWQQVVERIVQSLVD